MNNGKYHVQNIQSGYFLHADKNIHSGDTLITTPAPTTFDESYAFYIETVSGSLVQFTSPNKTLVAGAGQRPIVENAHIAWQWGEQLFQVNAVAPRATGVYNIRMTSVDFYWFDHPVYMQPYRTVGVESKTSFRTSTFSSSLAGQRSKLGSDQLVYHRCSKLRAFERFQTVIKEAVVSKAENLSKELHFKLYHASFVSTITTRIRVKKSVLVLRSSRVLGPKSPSAAMSYKGMPYHKWSLDDHLCMIMAESWRNIMKTPERSSDSNFASWLIPCKTTLQKYNMTIIAPGIYKMKNKSTSNYIAAHSGDQPYSIIRTANPKENGTFPVFIGGASIASTFTNLYVGIAQPADGTPLEWAPSHEPQPVGFVPVNDGSYLICLPPAGNLPVERYAYEKENTREVAVIRNLDEGGLHWILEKA
ncbi:hypothetical protein D9757_010391 [Collybiopsis confluens]|uniref:Uncharacterized protein n=1 Tax=Collybiopsis confluens TaxID=2823264 RepID=A0A8H5GUM6_9AGAR|nr:hypothetical protein D9757_010391 [Collybiopsis confluens]